MIGERIRQLRSEKGMSQEQLAEALHISRQAVSKWETGESVPDTDRVMLLCHVLDISADYLLFGKENEQTATPIRSAAERNKPGKALTIAGSVSAGIGTLGLLVMWVLSTMLVSDVWTEVGITNSQTGETYYEIQNYGVYDFPSFIETHRLHALVFICVILLVSGIITLLVQLYRTRKFKS